MARYIDADAFIRILNAKVDMAMGTPKAVFLSVAKMVDYLPHSDVAPKSEVERLEQEIETLKDNNEHLAVMLTEAKSDVAREIFEEIELFLNKAIDGWKKERRFCYHDRDIEMIDFRNGTFKYCLHEIAELKKKYTEEKE